MKSILKDTQNNLDLYKCFFENANDGLVFLDQEAIIRASNKKIEDLFGYYQEDVIGKPFTDFPVFEDDNMAMVMNLFIESLEGRLPPLMEFEGIHRSGRRFYLEINPTVIQQDGDTVGILAIIRDTTARKRLEHERERLIDIIDATPDFVFTYDSDDRITYINQAGRDRLGLDTTEDLIMADLPRIPESSQVKVGKGVWAGESQISLKDDTKIHVAHVVMEHYQKNMNEPFFSMIMKDMTEQKQKENHIKYLTRHLMKVQEDERARISRDLHDHLAQDLSSLKIFCASLFDNHPEIPEGILTKMANMAEVFQRCIDSIRDISYNLRPPSLLDLGLVTELGKFCNDFQDDQLEVSFYSAGMNNVTMDPDERINLFRIVQESFNNIKKHAAAHHVILTLTASHPTIILKIEDDGCGFDVDKRKKELIFEKCMGLTSMEERVCLLNGTFKIKSKLDVGTLIHVEIPMNTAWHPTDQFTLNISNEEQDIEHLEQ